MRNAIHRNLSGHSESAHSQLPLLTGICPTHWDLIMVFGARTFHRIARGGAWGIV
jgi:hypothetical protein